MMRTALLLAWLAVVSTVRGDASLSAEIRIDEPVFLPGEDLPAGLRLVNLSGRPVKYAATPDWVTFFVERPGGSAVIQRAELEPTDEFTLESATAGTREWNLASAFDLTTPGTYSISAQVRVPDAGVTLFAPPQTVLVSPGMTLSETTFGRPAPEGGHEVRKYTLIQANRKRDLRLYVSVADEAGLRPWKVTSLERLLSFSRPEHQLDRESNLHIILQSGAREFSYFTVNPDGELIGRQRHMLIPGSRPRLAAGTNGLVTVAGGARVPLPTDLPPAPPPALAEASLEPPPASGAAPAP